MKNIIGTLLLFIAWVLLWAFTPVAIFNAVYSVFVEGSGFWSAVVESILIGGGMLTGGIISYLTGLGLLGWGCEQ